MIFFKQVTKLVVFFTSFFKRILDVLRFKKKQTSLEEPAETFKLDDLTKTESGIDVSKWEQMLGFDLDPNSQLPFESELKIVLNACRPKFYNGSANVVDRRMLIEFLQSDEGKFLISSDYQQYLATLISSSFECNRQFLDKGFSIEKINELILNTPADKFNKKA